MSDPASMTWQGLLSGIRFARRLILKFGELEARRPQLAAYACRERVRFERRLEELEQEWQRRTGKRVSG